MKTKEVRMLRTEVADSSKDTLLADNIPIFYEIIATFAKVNLRQEPCAGTLEMLRKNYHEFLLFCFKKFTLSATECQTKIKLLVYLVDLLNGKGFFLDKIDLAIVKAIREDILEMGSGLVKQVSEDQDLFIDQIRAIQSACETRFAPSSAFIGKIQLRTGLSTSERLSLNFSPFHQTSSISFSAYRKGIEFYNKKEWNAAILCFEEAVALASTVASEFKTEIKKENISLYQRYIALALFNHGNDLKESNEFKNAMDKYLKAISYLLKLDDKELLLKCQRGVKFCLHSLGIKCYKYKLYKQAIQCYQGAIDAHHQINDSDETVLHVYQRNLANAHYELARTDPSSDVSIEHYNKAAEIYKKIDDRTEYDEKFEAHCYRNLANIYHKRGIQFLEQRNFAQAQQNFNGIFSAFNKIPEKFITAEDRENEKRYVKNLEKTITDSIAASVIKDHGFFNLPDHQTFSEDSMQTATELGKRKRMSLTPDG